MQSWWDLAHQRGIASRHKSWRSLGVVGDEESIVEVDFRTGLLDEGLVVFQLARHS